MKKTILAVFFTWSILDYIIHGLILSATYASTPQLWRPMGEMKMGLMYFTTFATATTFVYIYKQFIAEKSVKTAIFYGLILGTGMGIGMGYGTYSVMPIPYVLAFTWFLGTVVEYAVGGLATGLIIKK